MSVQRTLAIVKPDAVAKGVTGKIIARIEDAGFTILGAKLVHMSLAQARGFYYVHRQRPFFGELVQFMTRSPVVVAVLEREDAVTGWRDLMGATDPAKAAPNTIRKLFGANVGENATHGSDSLDNAKRLLILLIAFFQFASKFLHRGNDRRRLFMRHHGDRWQSTFLLDSYRLALWRHLERR